MKLNDFVRAFEEIVMVPQGTVNKDTILSSLDDWDSLSRASLLSLFEEEFDLKLEESVLRNCKSFSEILEFLGERIEE